MRRSDRLGRGAAVGYAALGTLAALAYTTRIVPPWADKTVPACVGVAAGVALLTYLWWRPPIWTRGRRANGEPTHNMLLVALSIVIVLIAGALGSIAGAAALGSHSLPDRPAETAAVGFVPCSGRGCYQRVTIEVGGERITARYAGANSPGVVATVGAPFVYDLADATHLMPRRSFEYGRGDAPRTAALCALAIVLTFAVAFARSLRRADPRTP